jgi:hypothetical protein
MLASGRASFWGICWSLNRKLDAKETQNTCRWLDQARLSGFQTTLQNGENSRGATIHN